MIGDLNSKEAAKRFVIQLIIDEGIPSLGHRYNIMNQKHRVLGFGFYMDMNATYKNSCVQDFVSNE